MSKILLEVELLFDNEKIINNSLSEVRKKTGMIFQEFNLINNLSAINNVLTGILNSETSIKSLFYFFTKDQKMQLFFSIYVTFFF